MRTFMYQPQGRSDLVGPALRAALTEDADAALQALFAAAGDGPGVALIGVGSLGRGELTPRSDLDLVLLYRGTEDAKKVAKIADAIWYPIWNAGLALDHSVRTVAQALEVARGDLKAMVGLLDLRHIAGDETVSAELREAHLKQWRADANRCLPELAASCRERASRVGELAFLLEPDLKEARGGLRDAQALWQIAASQRADRPTAAIQEAKAVLLDARGELHKRAASDRLALQEQDAVAAALGIESADALMAKVAGAARAIAYVLDVTFRRVLPSPAPARRGPFGRRGSVRTPLADGVVAQGGEVVLALEADPDRDPVLGLRAAAAAAHAGLPLSQVALERLAAGAALPEPWPAAGREAFVDLLGAGPGAVPVLEACDQAGLLVRWLPEWEHTRSHPQRNAYHTYTVDRHLIEAAANAAGLTRNVSRPDLLLLGTLLHDIGKGLPGDHTEVGIELVGRIGPRIGLTADETAVLQQMVRHHLLLADVAQRRDLDDPATINAVAAQVGDRLTLELLAALTEADSKATGPAAWSSWKEGLLRRLVARVSSVLEGSPPPVSEPTPQQQAMLDARDLAILPEGDAIDISYPDVDGVLAMVAGVLALHRLEIRTLTAFSRDGWAVVTAVAQPRYGTGPDWQVVRTDLAAALQDGGASLGPRVADRAAAYPPPPHAQPPSVRWIDDDVTAPVLEVRAPDGIGVLYRIAAAITAAGGGVLSARCQTLGADVVDSFSVAPLDPAGRAAVEVSVLSALAGSAPTAAADHT